MGKSSKFLPEIDRLRGVAIFLIVISHATFSSRHSLSGYPVWLATAGGTWPFVFISGYLTAHLSAQADFLPYLKKKALNVVVPYCVVVSAGVAVGLTRNDAPIWEYYLLGWPAAGPLWFIPMICLFFVAFPIYRLLIARPPVAVAAAATFVGVTLLTGRTQFDAGPHMNFVTFQAPYLIGIVCCLFRDQFDRFMQTALPLLLVALMAAMALASGPLMAQFEMVPMLLMTLVLIPLLKADSALNPMWEWLAARSFGIFFLHGFFTDLQRRTLGEDLPLWATLAYGLVLLFGCGLFIDLVRKVAGQKSRILVGA